MPLLPDIQIGALGGDPQQQINSIVRQLNEWGRLISAETRVRTIKANDGSVVGMGQIPGTDEEIGLFALDPDGNLVWKHVGATGKIFDVTNSVGVILDGKLPDDTFGTVMAKEGEEVDDVFD